MKPSDAGLLESAIDRDFVIDTLLELVKVPTDVPLGTKTLMDPDDPKLVHYVQDVVRPLLSQARIYDIIEAPLNQIVVRAGSGRTKESLLIMAYTVSQHQNFTKDPFRPRIAIPYEHGVDEPCVFGQGVSQNKAHQAAMIGVLKALRDTGVELGGTLYFGVNNEGRSSHACSDAIIDVLDPKPRCGIVLTGTGMKVQLGNRGRVDVYVHIHGKATHSSTPWLGLSAIDGANEAISRIKRMKFTKVHPQLGGLHAVPYQVSYEPLAPHTLPSYARITVDRRLLPGDNIDEAVEGVKAALGDMSPWKVTVERGVHMLPALVDPDAPIVTRMLDSYEAVRGTKATTSYASGSYDAGGPCARGVPVIQWGASGGSGLLGDDFVPVKDVIDEARILARLISSWLR